MAFLKKPGIGKPDDQLRVLWSSLMMIGVIALFLYQVSFNVEYYLSQPTTFSITLEPNRKFLLPPLSVCPHPAFDPERLKNLGVNVTGERSQVQKNLLSLRDLSENLTSLKLWREARWTPRQIFSSLSFNSSYFGMYISNDTLDNIWYYSYSPLGPCFTLHPPLGVTSVEVELRTRPFVKLCQNKDPEIKFSQFVRAPESCDFIESNCTNTTCGFERYIYYNSFEKAYLFFHRSPVQPPKDAASDDEILKYSALLYDGHHILKVLEKNLPFYSRPQMVESSLITAPCIASKKYSYEKCYYNLLKSHFKSDVNSSCLPVSPRSMNLTVKETCSSPQEFDHFYLKQLSFTNQCLQKCKTLLWNHEFSEYYDYVLKAGFEAKTQSIKKVIELRTYPMIQLFSDLGGSLGLFLGISLLYIWEGGVWLINHILKKVFIKDKERFYQTLTLVRYTGILFFLIPMSIQIIELVKAFIMQPKFYSIHLEYSQGSEYRDIQESVAHRLASHTLGCRPHEAASVRCQVKCLLEKAMGDGAGVVPFIDVDGLPYCENISLFLPRYEYILPAQLYISSTLNENINKCNASCNKVQENLNNTQEGNTEMHMKGRSDFYLISTLRLICNLGGVVGLYLGYSISDAVDFICYIWSYFNKGRPTSQSEKPSSSRLKIVKILIFTFGLSVVLWELHNFILYHQVTTSISSKSYNSHSTPQVLTVCRWPPFSFDHLSSSLQINASEKLLLKIPKEERLQQLLQIMEELPGNWSGSINNLWEKSAWNISDVLNGFIMYNQNETYRPVGAFCESASSCLQFWTPVMTQMNRCFSLNLTQNNSELMSVTLYFPTAVEKANIFGFAPQIYFTVHSYGEPPLISKMVKKNRYKRVIADLHLTTYQSYHQALDRNMSHSLCVQNCMDDKVEQIFNCRLPYAKGNFKLKPCNTSQYSFIPAYFKGLYGIGQDSVSLKQNNRISQSTIDIYDTCHFRCKQYQKVFTAFFTNTFVDYNPSVTVQVEKMQESETLHDEDRHTLGQFFSNIGGIAGLAFGISLSIILKDHLPKALGILSREKCNCKKTFN